MSYDIWISKEAHTAMVVRTLLSRQVADALRDMIVRGEYKTGDRLPPIQNMAKDFQVSVSSMRESLRALETAGLLTVRHGKGVYVSDRIALSDDSVSTMLATDQLKLRTVYEARIVVEVGALPLAVERATNTEIAHLRTLADNLDLSAPPQDISSGDMEFHMRLIEIAGNPLLREMLSPLVRAIANDIRFVHSLPEELPEFARWHRCIVDALEARNAPLCEETMRKHLMRGLEILTSQVAASAARA
jgi:GntR family transcriptional regulator, transcriptional repressor for pyruvate dehydrogenase complex